MPQLDISTWPPQIFWLAVTFIALYWVVSRIVVPRTGGAIEHRRGTIESNLNDAQTMKGKADAAVKAYEARLAEARASAGAVAKDNQAKLESELGAERAKLNSSIQTMLADADRRVGDAKAKAMAEAKTVASDIAASIVNELTGAKPADKAVADAVAAVRS